MNTIKGLGRWGLPLAGLWFFFWGIGAIFGLSLPGLLMGLLALMAGILILVNT